MEFPNRPQGNNPASERRKMTAHEVNNFPKMNAGTAGIVQIGIGVKVTGTFDACEIAEIYGSLDGKIKTRELVIHEGGRLTGVAICKMARISGELSGEIEASELLQIHNTGTVDRKIGYTRLVIEDGGLIKGEVSPKENDLQQRAPSRPLSASKDDYAIGESIASPVNRAAAE